MSSLVIRCQRVEQAADGIKGLDNLGSTSYTNLLMWTFFLIHDRAKMEEKRKKDEEKRQKEEEKRLKEEEKLKEEEEKV